MSATDLLVSDDLTMSAGRWKSRATMEQFKTITVALNDVSLVTVESVRLKYELEQTFNHQ